MNHVNRLFTSSKIWCTLTEHIKVFLGIFSAKSVTDHVGPLGDLMWKTHQTEIPLDVVPITSQLGAFGGGGRIML